MRPIATMGLEDTQRNIVIVGGGIIGCCTAYFLTRHPSYNPALHTITILEATSIASASSGKAGGLLALWAYPNCIVPLSYRLHAELAKEHNGVERWGYRQVSCGSLSLTGRQLSNSPNSKAETGEGEDWHKLPKAKGVHRKQKGLPEDLDWFAPGGIKSYSEMGDPSTTAQVHPKLFTESIAALAADAGAKVILGRVTDIDYTSGEVSSVSYEDKASGATQKIPATDVVISAGPWSTHVFPQVRMNAMRAHSVTIKADVSPYAVFTEIRLPSDFNASRKRRHDALVSPEMYARPNGEVYACGEGDTLIPLPKTSDLVQCDEERCQDIVDYCASVSDEMANGEVLVKQACYLPSVKGGGPIIGETGIKGLRIATGHTCWGIQNAPGTGKVMAEFIFDGKAKSAKIQTLDPRGVLDL